jgi:hypothetical protein
MSAHTFSPSLPAPSSPGASSPDPASPAGRAAWPALLALAWLLASLAVALSGLMQRPPLPLIPALIFGPVVAYLALRRNAGVARDLDTLPLWPLVLYHLVRLPYGLYFLAAHARGELPAAFALTAGYGDILSGALALPAAWAALAPAGAQAGRRRLILVWSVIALCDMLLVIATAQRLILLDRNPQMLEAFTHLPYSVLPTFVVPMVLVTQLEVLRRVRRR